MITNLFPVRLFPNPLYVARLNHDENPPVNTAFLDSGVAHCFRHSNIYFWGNSNEVSEICRRTGWGCGPVDAYQVSCPGAIYDWAILQVLLYRAFNAFLRSNGFSVRYEDAYMKRQPNAEPVKLVYTDTSKLPARFHIHEGFTRSFVSVQEQVYLVLLPRIVITEPRADGRRDIKGPESTGSYTRVTYRRRANRERDMVQYWGEYLSQGESRIVVPIRGSSPLMISKQPVSL